MVSSWLPPIRVSGWALPVMCTGPENPLAAIRPLGLGDDLRTAVDAAEESVPSSQAHLEMRLVHATLQISEWS